MRARRDIRRLPAGAPLPGVFLVLTSCLVLAPQFSASDQDAPDDRLEVYGDVRLRLERDWDSTRPDGTKRDDRDRLRGRLRIGFVYRMSDLVSFGGRLRSGSRESQQSPHVTLGDDFEPKEINVDKLYVEAQSGKFWGWGGKNSFPFWKQNELFWDDDVTPEGLVGGYRRALNTAEVHLTAGYFVLDDPEVSNEFGDKARLVAGQATYSATRPGDAFTGAVGYFDFKDNPDAVNPALQDLDYSILLVNLKLRVPGIAKPLVLGGDYMENMEDYPDTLFNRDQTTGYVFSALLGELKDKDDWLVGYYYAHVEQFAVVPFFAQDDWLRWGTSTETRSSNFKGHELRVAYAFGPKFNLMARLYTVEGIQLQNPSSVAKEDGNRFRVDLNLGF